MKANYTIPYKRKKQGRTNYKKRLALLKSRETRLVIRKTNTQIIIQFTNYKPDGDEVIVSYNSSKLKEDGWKDSYKNLPSAYLAGYKAGLLAQKKGVKKAVLDTGLQIHKKGNRIYSAVKGIVDSGLKIPVDEKVYPKEERVKGEHISKEYPVLFEKTMKKISKG